MARRNERKKTVDAPGPEEPGAAPARTKAIELAPEPEGIGSAPSPVETKMDQAISTVRTLVADKQAAEELAARKSAEASERAEAQRLAESKAAAAIEAREAAEARAADAERQAEEMLTELQSHLPKEPATAEEDRSSARSEVKRKRRVPHPEASPTTRGQAYDETFKLEAVAGESEDDRLRRLTEQVFARPADAHYFAEEAGADALKLLEEWWGTGGTIIAQLVGGESDGTPILLDKHERRHSVPVRPGRIRRLLGRGERFEVYVVKSVWVERPSWLDRPARHVRYELEGRRSKPGG